MEEAALLGADASLSEFVASYLSSASTLEQVVFSLLLMLLPAFYRLSLGNAVLFLYAHHSSFLRASIASFPRCWHGCLRFSLTPLPPRQIFAAVEMSIHLSPTEEAKENGFKRLLAHLENPQFLSLSTHISVLSPSSFLSFSLPELLPSDPSILKERARRSTSGRNRTALCQEISLLPPLSSRACSAKYRYRFFFLAPFLALFLILFRGKGELYIHLRRIFIGRTFLRRMSCSVPRIHFPSLSLPFSGYKSLYTTLSQCPLPSFGLRCWEDGAVDR